MAINRDKYGYHFLIDKHKNDDGWINEGSPHYHYYPLEFCCLQPRVRCRGIDLFDCDLHDMFVEPVKGTYPDLSFPAHSDGWYGANLLSQSALCEVANTVIMILFTESAGADICTEETFGCRSFIE